MPNYTATNPQAGNFTGIPGTALCSWRISRKLLFTAPRTITVGAGRVEGPDGEIRLVKRNATLVKPSQAQVYLPDDIHDTLCVAGPALLFRFTERDLKHEDLVEKKVTRYVQREGYWSAA